MLALLDQEIARLKMDNGIHLIALGYGLDGAGQVSYHVIPDFPVIFLV